MNSLAVANRTPRSVANGRAPIDGSSPILAFQREMNQLLDDAFGGFGFTRTTSNLPPVEVHEAEQDFRVSVDLPGVQLEDVEVSFNDGALTIKAQRKAVNGPALYSDRWSGGFERVIGIGSGIDESQIRATLQNGVLTVTLPKHPDRLPRRIEVQ